jgi:excisionase family DNA binding protein
MEKLLTPDQVAEFLSISRNMVYRIINTGKLEAIKVENILRIPEESLKEYIDRNKKNSNGEQLKKKRFSIQGIFEGGGAIPEEAINEAIKEWDKVKELQ